ncbi:MAG TPA: hypothetical protein VD969_23030 [Symbiobacteriaceae bacterium]|nr:hypothetical protein [Symbiobacteriaceae bacterium]
MNMFEAYALALVQQEVLRRKFDTEANHRRVAEEMLAERAEERRFLLMYRVRHWVHRLVPRMARAFL